MQLSANMYLYEVNMQEFLQHSCEETHLFIFSLMYSLNKCLFSTCSVDGQARCQVLTFQVGSDIFLFVDLRAGWKSTYGSNHPSDRKTTAGMRSEDRYEELRKPIKGTGPQEEAFKQRTEEGGRGSLLLRWQEKHSRPAQQHTQQPPGQKELREPWELKKSQCTCRGWDTWDNGQDRGATAPPMRPKEQGQMAALVLGDEFMNCLYFLLYNSFILKKKTNKQPPRRQGWK